MSKYDVNNFYIPAPITHVTLTNDKTGVMWSNVPVLIDTGSDVTLIPSKVIERLQLAIDNTTQYELTGFDEKTSLAHFVNLTLIFEGYTFRGQFLLVDQDMGILGRNVLNRLKLTFDGPNLQWFVAK